MKMTFASNLMTHIEKEIMQRRARLKMKKISRVLDS